MEEQIKIEYIPVNDLTPSDYNPRKELSEGDREFEQLKASIEKFGFIDPIIYNEQTGRIVGGHQRWKVAKSIGMMTVPTVKINVPEEQEKVLNVGLNKLGGEFDEEKLGELLADIEDMGDELLLTGFEDFEIDALITSVEVNAEDTLSDLDGYLGSDDEDDGDYDPDIDEPDDDEDDEEEPSFTMAEGYVKYQVPMQKEERQRVIEAVNEAKAILETDLSNEALFYVADQFLKERRK